MTPGGTITTVPFTVNAPAVRSINPTTMTIKFAAGIMVGSDAVSVRTPGQLSEARRSNVTATLATVSLKMTGSRAAARVPVDRLPVPPSRHMTVRLTVSA
jgi:hypothetical protein